MAWHLTAALFILGVWGLVTKRNLVKKVIALGLINTSVLILFVYLGSLSGNEAPILVTGAADVVDPLPQALMLTAIVVGVCVTAFSLALILKVYRHYGSLDVRVIETRIREADE